MADDGSVNFTVTADDADAQKKLNALRKEIEKIQKDLASKEESRSAISESLSNAREEAEKTAEEIRNLKEELSENARILSGQEGDIDLEEYNARQQAQKEMNYELNQQTKQYERQNKAVAELEAKERTLTSQIDQQTKRLAAQKEQAGQIEKSFASQASSTMPKVTDAISKASASIKKGIKNVLLWGLGIRSVYALISKMRSAIKEGINDYAKVDPETKKNIDDLKSSLNALKGSFGAAFAPVLSAVIPILQKLIGWLQTAIEYIGMFFAAFSGKSTYKKAIANNNALADSYNGAGSAAKEAKKQLMGFDEIKKLNSDSGGGGGGGGGGLPLADYVDEDIPSKFQNVVQAIKDNIYLIEGIVGTALVAIGAILLFTWAAPMAGLAMIAAGAAMTYNVIMNWDTLPKEMQDKIAVIMTLVGAALIVLGAVFLFTGNIPIGLGLLLAGGIAAGVSVALNWDAVKQALQGPVGEVVAIVGAALLAIGAVLAFSGANLPLGIALMIVGAASIAGVAALNWNTIKQKLQGPLGLILTLLGASLVVLGAVLVFTGAALPLGLGLMIAGGYAFGVGAANYDWNALLDKLKGVWDNIKNWWNTNVSQYFTKSYWKEKLTNLIDGIELPKIKLPHFEITWEPAEGWMADALNFFGLPATVPHINVAWYAKGGIVDGPTLLGAGEAGKEAIIPLERNTEWIDMVANGIIDRITGNSRFADAITGAMLPAIARGQIVPPRALSGGGSMFTDGDIQKLVSGIAEALSSNSEGQTIKLYLDGRQIAETVTKHQRQMARGMA